MIFGCYFVFSFIFPYFLEIHRPIPISLYHSQIHFLSTLFTPHAQSVHKQSYLRCLQQPIIPFQFPASNKKYRPPRKEQPILEMGSEKGIRILFASFPQDKCMIHWPTPLPQIQHGRQCAGNVIFCLLDGYNKIIP